MLIGPLLANFPRADSPASITSGLFLRCVVVVVVVVAAAATTRYRSPAMYFIM